MVSNHLPGAGKDFVLLLRRDCGFEVEGGRQGPGTGDVGIDQRRLNEGHGMLGCGQHCTAAVGMGKGFVAGRWSVVPVSLAPAAKISAAGQARAPVPTWSESDTNWLTKFVRGDVSFQSERREQQRLIRRDGC